MTFKKQLIAKANKVRIKEDVDSIKEDVEYIKKQMDEFYACCEYTVSLVRAHSHMAIGRAHSNRTSLFVPIGISPEYYLKLFVDAFKDLGFTEEDMTFTYADNEDFESYDIILKW